MSDVINNSAKIVLKKIYEVKNLVDEDVDYINYDVHLIHIVRENLPEVQKALARISFESFPNTFMMVLEIIHVNDKSLIDFFELLKNIIPIERQMFIQIWSTQNKFYKKKEFEMFKEIKLDSIEKMTEPHSRIVKEEFFFVSIQQNSLVDADFYVFSKKFSMKFLNPLALVEKFIKDNNQNMINFSMLFVNDLDDKLLKTALDQKYSNIIYNFLKHFKAENVTETQFNEIIKSNDHRNNILKLSAEEGNVGILNILLKKGCDILASYLNIEIWKEIKNLAYENNFIEFYKQIQFLEFFFVEQYKVFSKSIPSNKSCAIFFEDLHEEIHQGNFEYVQNYVKDYPMFKYCLYKNETALETAIRQKQFSIYAFLFSQGFLLHDEVTFANLTEKFTNEEKQTFDDKILNYLTPCQDTSSHEIAKKIYISRGPSKFSFELITKFLLKLKNIDRINKIMNIASQADIKIIFDFMSRRIMLMSAKENSLGYYFNRHVYVSKTSNTNQALSTFIHELTHCKDSLIYENKELPYVDGDEAMKDICSDLISTIDKIDQENPRKTDIIISRIFKCYEHEEERIVELVARIPEIICHHADNPERLRELKLLFQKAFDFMRYYVFPDLEVNIYRMIKVNNEFGLVDDYQQCYTSNNDVLDYKGDKPLLVISDAPKLLILQICYKLFDKLCNKLYLKVDNLFVDFKKLNSGLKQDLFSLVRTEPVEKVFCLISFEKDFLLLNELRENLDEKKTDLCIIIDKKHQKIIKDITNYHIINQETESLPVPDPLITVNP